MAQARANGICLEYEIDGPEDAPVLLMIHGVGAQLIRWPPDLCRALVEAGFRVLRFDPRDSGLSTHMDDAPVPDLAEVIAARARGEEPDLPFTLHDLAADAVGLLDQLGIPKAVVMGYSMGARIASFVARDYANRVGVLILGGLGDRLLQPAGLPSGIAEALEAPSADSVRDSMGRMFRSFAEQTKSDLKALAACIRGSRQHLTEAEAGAIVCPVLVAVGTMDLVSGNGQNLARYFPHGEFFEILRRDHNQAVGDRTHRAAVLEFLQKVQS